ncbi:MAG: TlpA family protein disulfide reductase [Phenylobacterium sp.]|uniref:TlpA family protein disulfide reductase n=1 Tax=Phenylobacterium sp. TaxID=1871053 RepID=UPI0011FCDD23|nr:TlpA disulfide reductase family protein [Phenylobacterium sp.]TAJ69859.1 MAG: TlpA family protein disulfide reductase [Phenylobacterium sp.]
MSEGPAAETKPKGKGLVWALWGAALVGVAAVVYIIGSSSTKPTPPAPSASVTATSFASKLTTPTQPTSSPDYTFYDGDGKAMKLADLKGKVVVMNIWATWCAPCVTEMPTLAKLQAAYAGKPVEVVTVSIDSESSAAKARIFIAQHSPLKFYHDREMKLPFKLSPPAPGAPTTVIYGKDGMEVARVAGEADWSGPEARALVDKALGS